MRVSKRASWAAVAITLVVALAACDGSTTSDSNTTESSAANAGINLLLQNQPVPIFPTSAYRTELMEIEAIEALGTPTTAFFFPEGTTVINQGGAYKFSSPPFKSCPAEGEPIPNTASLTNPQQIQAAPSHSSAVVGEMDPIGAYTPANSSGTNVLCDTSSGGQKLAYWEGPVFDESGAAVWDTSTGQITDVGPSQLPVCTIEHARLGDSTGLMAGTAYYHCVPASK